jgi:hypothetical protein
MIVENSLVSHTVSDGASVDRFHPLYEVFLQVRNIAMAPRSCPRVIVSFVGTLTPSASGGIEPGSIENEKRRR